jgi:hypothetical protein
MGNVWVQRGIVALVAILLANRVRFVQSLTGPA